MSTPSRNLFPILYRLDEPDAEYEKIVEIDAIRLPVLLFVLLPDHGSELDAGRHRLLRHITALLVDVLDEALDVTLGIETFALRLVDLAVYIAFRKVVITLLQHLLILLLLHYFANELLAEVTVSATTTHRVTE